MKKKATPTIFLLLFALLSCSGIGGKNGLLTNQRVEAYLNAYKELRSSAPDFLNQANSGNIDNQKQGFSDFEGVIKKHGLSYMEFVKINAKVGAIYSVLNAESFMGDMEKMKGDGMEQMDNGIKQMQAQIDDPNVPEKTKAELRKAIEEMETSQKEINTHYTKNKYWADLVMDKTKSISNQFINKEEIELVKQSFDKITEAYTGGVIPSNFNISENE